MSASKRTEGRLDRGSLAHAAAASIRAKIRDDGLVVGDSLPPVTELAAQLNVSRTIARDAIELLAAERTIARSEQRRWRVHSVPHVDVGHSPVEVGVEHRSLADQVADAILAMVLAEGLTTGDALPPARELSQKFNVSTVVIREALSALAARGLLNRRQGREALVALPDYRLLGSLMHARAHLDGIAASDFQRAREVLEVEAARLAAFGRDPRRREILEPHLVGMFETAGHDESARIRHDLDFHLALAGLSGNRAIELVLKSLHELIVIHMRIATREVRARAGRRGQELSLEAHRRVFEAVVEGDVDGAESAVRGHFSVIDKL